MSVCVCKYICGTQPVIQEFAATFIRMLMQMLFHKQHAIRSPKSKSGGLTVSQVRLEQASKQLVYLYRMWL